MSPPLPTLLLRWLLRLSVFSAVSKVYPIWVFVPAETMPCVLVFTFW
ncbi:hypothetical protein l11_03750 [Neisseria weaveri LMG 5135]|nr:hypothetical protein l13_01180 [Neisseria weaveri ATCC 51223]EGV38630.1 hypothetical protein l11_03750 [Neisseria weaveri LMG 5135]